MLGEGVVSAIFLAGGTSRLLLNNVEHEKQLFINSYKFYKSFVSLLQLCFFCEKNWTLRQDTVKDTQSYIITQHKSDRQRRSCTVKGDAAGSQFLRPQSLLSFPSRASLNFPIIQETVLAFLKRIFLPVGYPLSTTDSYLQFSQNTFFQILFSQMSRIMATQAMLLAVGVGTKQTMPLAAVTAWVLKDGIGHMVAIAFGTFINQRFDSDPKRFRFQAATLGKLADSVSILTLHWPQYFLPLSALGGAFARLSANTGASCRPKIYETFTRSSNLGDIMRRGPTFFSGGGIWDDVVEIDWYWRHDFIVDEMWEGINVLCDMKWYQYNQYTYLWYCTVCKRRNMEYRAVFEQTVWFLACASYVQVHDCANHCCPVAGYCYGSCCWTLSWKQPLWPHAGSQALQWAVSKQLIGWLCWTSWLTCDDHLHSLQCSIKVLQHFSIWSDCVPWVEKGGPFLLLIFREEFRLVPSWGLLVIELHQSYVCPLCALAALSQLRARVFEVINILKIPYFFSKISLYLAISHPSIQIESSGIDSVLNWFFNQRWFRSAISQQKADGWWLAVYICDPIKRMWPIQALGPIPFSIWMCRHLGV